MVEYKLEFTQLNCESDIKSTWKSNDVLLSILCPTYNHEKFIETTIKGFLIQKTNFAFEIIINDDASTDNTAEIIKRYSKKYPNIIKPIFQKTNQYSKNIFFLCDIFPSYIKGDYIALCEGDDYWTDPFKLQKQVSLMESYKNIDFSFHKMDRIDVQENRISETGKYRNKNSIIPTTEIIEKRFGPIETASYMMRASKFNQIITFLNKYEKQLPVGDFFIEIIASGLNGALYINDNMGVYRFRTPNSFSQKNHKNEDNKLNSICNLLRTFEYIDSYHNYTFSNTYNKLFYRYLYTYFENYLQSNPLMNYYKDYLNKLLIDLTNHNEQYILYGFGKIGKFIFTNISQHIEFIVDKDYLNINDEQCFSLEELSKSNLRIIISPIIHTKNITLDLISKYQIDSERIINLEQSFPNYIDFLKASNDKE